MAAPSKHEYPPARIVIYLDAMLSAAPDGEWALTEKGVLPS